MSVLIGVTAQSGITPCRWRKLCRSCDPLVWVGGGGGAKSKHRERSLRRGASAFGGWGGGASFKHVESDATGGLNSGEPCSVVALTKRRDIQSRRGA